jgi:hypothetical protein
MEEAERNDAKLKEKKQKLIDEKKFEKWENAILS